MLQVPASPCHSVDAGTVRSGPSFNHTFAAVIGQVPMGKHPSNDSTDPVLRFSVESPAAHIPVYPEKGGGLIGEVPVFVGVTVLRHVPVIRAKNRIHYGGFPIVSKKTPPRCRVI